MRTTLILLLPALFGAAAAGQAHFPSRPALGCQPASIERGLASTERSEIAWAAWCAGAIAPYPELARRNQELPPKVRAALQHALTSADNPEGRKLIRVLLDVLLRWDFPVPVEEAVAVYDVYPDAAVALIVKARGGGEPQRSDVLRLLHRAEEEGSRARWLALASVLRLTRELKLYLLDRAHFNYSITIRDDSDFREVGVYVRSLGVIGGVRARGPGWPPNPLHSLSTNAAPGAEVLVPFVGVYLERHNVEDADQRRRIVGVWEERSADMVRLLNDFAYCALCAAGPRTRQYGRVLGAQAEIEWRSAEQAGRTLRQLAESFIKECAAFMSGLQEGEWTPDQVRSIVTIEVTDHRSDRSIPIPEPGVPVRMRR